MIYKIGDKVLIKSKQWYLASKDSGGIVKPNEKSYLFSVEMSKYCGKYATVMNVLEDSYLLDIDGNCHYWQEYMLQIEEPNNQKSIKIDIPAGYEIDEKKSTFTNIVFKPIKQVKTWEDLEIVEGYYISDYSTIKHTSPLKVELNKNVFRTEKEAKSALAMAQISQLMPYYGGVITDEEWKNSNEFKYSIRRYENNIETCRSVGNFRFLAFHTAEQRNEFLKNNEQLVKDYLML